MIKKLLFAWFVCLSLACQQETTSSQLQIEFKPDSTGFVFLNIENSSLLLIKDMLDSSKNSDRAVNLVSVFQLNPDAEADLSIKSDSTQAPVLAEEEWPGKLSIVNNELIFIPEKPFEPGKEYLVETYIESSFGEMKAILTGKLGHKPNLKTYTLKR